MRGIGVGVLMLMLLLGEFGFELSFELDWVEFGWMVESRVGRRNTRRLEGRDSKH